MSGITPDIPAAQAPSAPTHVGVVVPVECVALEHKPAPLPLLGHEAHVVLLLEEPPIAVHPAKVPARDPPAAQPGRHSCHHSVGGVKGGKGEQSPPGTVPSPLQPSLAGSCSPFGLRPVRGLSWAGRQR